MLDVHPPHTATHTWKDFFIHIATIVIGLLIAIGLEQTVEWLHHRHQVHELREALREERDENRKIFPQNVALFRLNRAKLMTNLRILLYLQQHPATPEEKLPGVPVWTFGYDPVFDSAYRNAQQTQVLSMLPRKEAEAQAIFYILIDFQQTSSYRSVVSGYSAGGYAAADPNPSHLTAAALDKEIDRVRNSLDLNLEWGIWLMNVTKGNADFPGGPTPREIEEASGYSRSPEDKARLAVAQAQTDEILRGDRDALAAAKAAAK